MVVSCTNSKEEYNKHASLKPQIESTKKNIQTVPVDKRAVKKDIEKNINQIKSIEREINALLENF